MDSSDSGGDIGLFHRQSPCGRIGTCWVCWHAFGVPAGIWGVFGVSTLVAFLPGRLALGFAPGDWRAFGASTA